MKTLELNQLEAVQAGDNAGCGFAVGLFAAVGFAAGGPAGLLVGVGAALSLSAC